MNTRWPRGWPFQILRFNSPFYRDWLFWFVAIGSGLSLWQQFQHDNSLESNHFSYSLLLRIGVFAVWGTVGTFRVVRDIDRFD